MLFVGDWLSVTPESFSLGFRFKLVDDVGSAGGENSRFEMAGIVSTSTVWVSTVGGFSTRSASSRSTAFDSEGSATVSEVPGTAGLAR